MTGCCESIYGIEPDTSEQCGRPGAVLRRVMCVHEHWDEFYVCERCAAEGFGCTSCYEIDGHDCEMRSAVVEGQR
jgi:N-acetylglutamate synthase-like GNAT family acetyltransferase